MTKREFIEQFILQSVAGRQFPDDYNLAWYAARHWEEIEKVMQKDNQDA